MAKVKLTPSKNNTNPLYEFVKQRATNRAVYVGEFITGEEFSKLKELRKPENSELIGILGESAIMPYKDIFFEAMKLESLTYKTNEESRIWFRFNDRDSNQRDGIALPDQGYPDYPLDAETFLWDRSQKSFMIKRSRNISLEIQRKIDSTKGIVYWKTKTNTQKDWIFNRNGLCPVSFSGYFSWIKNASFQPGIARISGNGKRAPN